MSIYMLLLIMFFCESVLLLAIYISTVYMPIESPLSEIEEDVL